MQIKVNHDDPISVLESARALLNNWLGISKVDEEDMLEAQAAAHHQIPDDFDDGTLDVPPSGDPNLTVIDIPPPPGSVDITPPDMSPEEIQACHDVEAKNASDDSYPERDKGGDGVRWDERIHSANHKMTTRGVWNRRRNVPDDVFNAVMEELQAEVTTASQIFNSTPVTEEPVNQAATHNIPPPPGATAGLSLPPTPAATGIDWGMVFQRIMTGVSTEQVTMQQVDNAIDAIVPGKVFADLVTLPDYWEPVLMRLNL